MSAPRLLPALALLCLAALPLVAERLRSHPERCEMDGAALNPGFRARVIETGGAAHAFCGVACARSWLALSGIRPATVLVTDCVQGSEIDARNAWFVETLANWSDGAPDTIRVFASKDDADRHVSAHGGRLLTGADRPFGGEGEGNESN